MKTDDVKLLSNSEIPESVRVKLAEQMFASAERQSDRALEKERMASERQRIFWSTPLVASLAGLLTLSATFVFERISNRDKADQTITLEQVRNELQKSEAHLRQELEAENHVNLARLQAEAKEREFQYEIVRSELANAEKSDAERAAVLLFLVRSGILTSLDVDSLRDLAEKQLEDPERSVLPRLSTPEIHVGLTAEQFELELRRRESSLREQLNSASEAERRVLEAERQAIEARLSDAEASYEEAVFKLVELQKQLEKLGGVIDRQVIEEAQEALARGDTSLANELFARVENEAAASISQVADAAEQRGEIAEVELRWPDAIRHYLRSARLEPTTVRLLKASKLLTLSAQYDEASSIAYELLEFSRSKYGSESVETASALNNLAEILFQQGDLARVEPLLRESLTLRRRVLGEDHPEYAQSLNNLASLMSKQGRYDEAEALYRQSLEITAQSLGDDHPSFAIKLNNLAELIANTGRFEEAEGLYRRAMEILRKSIGENHPSFANMQTALAIVLARSGKRQEALDLQRTALLSLEIILATDHPAVKRAKENLALLENGLE